MNSTILLAIILALVIIAFIIYAVIVEKRHLEMQHDFDMRLDKTSTSFELRLKKTVDSFEERLEKKEVAFAQERIIFREERAKYVLEMLALFKDKQIDEYYNKHITLPDTEEKLKQVYETEEEPQSELE